MLRGKNKDHKKTSVMAVLLTAAMVFSACGGGAPAGNQGQTESSLETSLSSVLPVSDEEKKEEKKEESGTEGFQTQEGIDEAPEIPGLICESAMKVSYAECFHVYYYTDGYKVLDVKDGATYLLVPEGKEIPDDLDDTMIVIQQPLTAIYMAATSPMALFAAMDAIDPIRLSGLEADGWYVDAAKEAMNAGDLIFAGKYNEPDYELLVSENCDLAIESTMILHDPKVQEMIETLGIPVFIDRSSYENHPLGRTEWIKLYGAMVNKEEAAVSFFEEQEQTIDNLSDFSNTEKTVAFFYISSNGAAVVRNPKDYISCMIDLGGARNAFAGIADNSGKTSVNITMEEFYNTAADADYMIYNSSIDSSVKSINDLLAKDELLADCKAVKEGNVWTTEKAMYQETDTIAQFTNDINRMVTEGDPSEMVFLKKLS